MTKGKKQIGWAVIYKKETTLEIATRYGDTYSIFVTRAMARHYVSTIRNLNVRNHLEIIKVEFSIKSYR